MCIPILLVNLGLPIPKRSSCSLVNNNMRPVQQIKECPFIIEQRLKLQKIGGSFIPLILVNVLSRDSMVLATASLCIDVKLSDVGRSLQLNMRPMEMQYL